MKYNNYIIGIMIFLFGCNQDVGPYWAPGQMTSGAGGSTLPPIGQGGFGDSEDDSQGQPNDACYSIDRNFLVSYTIECEDLISGEKFYCQEDNREIEADSCTTAQRIIYDECKYTDFTNYDCLFEYWDCLEY